MQPANTLNETRRQGVGKPEDGPQDVGVGERGLHIGRYLHLLLQFELGLSADRQHQYLFRGRAAEPICKKQPYIIIYERRNIEDVKKDAEANEIPQDEIDPYYG